MRLALILVLTLPVWAQTGSISGIVVDGAGVPIYDARVSLQNDSQGAVGREISTQANGEFHID